MTKALRLGPPSASQPNRARPLSPLERACGFVLGQEDQPKVDDEREAAASARAALEEVIVQALRREPCVVSFSGGRDSSAILAVATHVARREGLNPPIPVTLRYPDVASTHEDEWQEIVIDHLALKSWERIEITEELDLLGDIARDCLLTYGLIWPPNVHLHVPIFDLARHGSVLTGLDGDGLFSGWRSAHVQAVLHRRAPFTPRDVARVGFAMSPAAIRGVVLKRRFPFALDWLQPNAHHAFVSAAVAEEAKEPRRWDDRVDWYAATRALHVCVDNMALIASDFDVEVVHPLFDSRFLAALAQQGGAVGYPTRTAAMNELFGDVLPSSVLSRRSKAEFGGVVIRRRARAFAESWDGTGVDTSWVKVDELRAAWLADESWFATWSPLQGAWLASQPAPNSGVATT